MPDSESSSASALLSPNTIMALITLVGGVLIVSHTLSSDRPRRPATDGTPPLGHQDIESRLWEDPFAAWNKLSDENREKRGADGVGVLARVLTNPLPSFAPTNLLVLGVMVSGGPYAEDTESRVRCRYAVGAALGVGGYKPAEAGHIGLAAAAWTESDALERWMRCTNTSCGRLPGVDSGPSCAPERPLVIPFEQYDVREFHPKEQGKPPTANYGRVLLVWLDEDYFSDEPAARLAMFFEQLKQVVPSLACQGRLQQAVIGPRTSSTLRTLMGSVPDLLSGTAPSNQITNTLNSVRLILATPTAMDELLVKPSKDISVEEFKSPRGAVARALEGRIFRSVTNFACTDTLMASEAIEELKLRGIDPARHPNQHIVLVSEWDTFFSRVSGIAFAAELSKRLADPTNQYATNALQFVDQARRRCNAWPPMLHRFVYLRGLDGEAAADSDRDSDGESQKKKSKLHRSEIVDEVARWTPDVNKAEGPAQLDYLNRLADMLEDMNRRLWREHARGRIAAVGIVGSDVYDTLLILQALRPRLPDVVFFTTDLDARYSDPRELEWSRNLVILSGYGLRLRDDLQSGVPPFRESAQSAQFLATLNALGHAPLAGTGTVLPRRFEIGRGGPVNLSIVEAGVHPPIRYRLGRLWSWWAAAVAILAISTLLLWKSARQMAFVSYEYRCQPLAVTEEDLGGREGLLRIIRNLESRRVNDKLAQWMLEDAPGSQVQHADEQWIQHCSKSLIAKLNALTFFTENRWPKNTAVEEGDLLDTELGRRWAATARDLREGRRRRLRAADAHANRQVVNDILIKLGRSSPSDVTDAKQQAELDSASESARRISLLQYKRRSIRPLLFWITASLFAAGCLTWAYLAKQDTFDTVTGEPFNFSGTSAWPATFIRWSVLALSALVVIRTQLRLGESILQISRRYRLPTEDAPCWRARWMFKLPEPPPTEYDVDANKLWNDYHRIRHWFPRLLRVLICVGAYFMFGFILSQLSTPAFSPVRGYTLLDLDKPLLFASVLAFLIVTFWIIDAACCCAWFIRRLSQAPTQYPCATLEHFTQQRAIDDRGLVEEWIDLQLIADLTEPVGRLVYWPFVAVSLLLLARNPWWDHWTWHWPLVVIFGVNLVLAAASSIILQNAARDARKTGVQRLKAKVHEKHRQSTTLKEHESDQAKSLLEEIMNLRRGAFAPMSRNPLVGALLVNSSGVVLLELVAQLYFK